MSQYSFEFANNNSSFLPDDFIYSENNKDSYTAIFQWPKTWSSNALIITGGSSSGKTHLANIWKDLSSAKYITSEEIQKNDISKTIETGQQKNVVIEDIDNLHDYYSQEKLFHLYNKIVNDGGYILITSSKPVLSLDFHFNDLRSRLLAATSVNIHEPDDEMMSIILAKYFSDRQLKISPEIIDFLIPRVERNFSSVKKVVEEIDDKSMEMQKAVTIPFVKEILGV